MMELHGWTGDGKVVALHVQKGAGVEHAGIRAGDVLVRIQGFTIGKSTEVPEALSRFPLWSKVTYLYRRNGQEVQAPVIIGESIPDSSIYYQYAVGFLYLLIGLFVYYRRVNAPRAVHFFILCLASFMLCCFHFTGKLNPFDQVIYWGNVVAGLLAPTVFLHFCLVFPERPQMVTAPWHAIRWLYLPATLLLPSYCLVGRGHAAGGRPPGRSALVPGPRVAAAT